MGSGSLSSTQQKPGPIMDQPEESKKQRKLEEYDKLISSDKRVYEDSHDDVDAHVPLFLPYFRRAYLVDEDEDEQAQSFHHLRTQNQILSNLKRRSTRNERKIMDMRAAVDEIDTRIVGEDRVEELSQDLIETETPNEKRIEDISHNVVDERVVEPLLFASSIAAFLAAALAAVTGSFIIPIFLLPLALYIWYQLWINR